MQFKLAIVTLIVLLGLSYSCFERPPKNNDLIVLRSNSTRETYLFDLNRLTLKDFQKTVEGEVANYWVPTPMKFTFHLLKCGPKSDYIPRRGHMQFNNQWLPMSKPCNDIAPKVFHRLPHESNVHMVRPQPTFERKKLHHMRSSSQKPSFRQRFMNKVQRWGGKANQEGEPKKVGHRHFAHNHPDGARHEHRPENNQRPPMGPMGSSIHQGYVSLLQTTPKAKPIGFTLTFNSEKPILTRSGAFFNIVAKVNVVCAREGQTENPNLSLVSHIITNNVYTVVFNHYSYAGCPQIAPERERHQISVAPMFFLFFLCSCCCQLLPCVAILIAVLIAIKKIQQIRKRNAKIAMQTTPTVLPQVQQPLPRVPVQFMPQPQIPQQVAQPVQKKEERKPMQQVGVQQTQPQQIELSPVVLPPMQPQYIQPPAQQPQYAFYPHLYPQVFVYPQQ